MKESVTALLINDDGKILCVSRRDDYNAMGLPGGKVDEGETPEQAIVREVKEETGLDLTKLSSYFIRQDGEHMNTTFLADYTGTISHVPEEGVVKWGTWEDLERGPFKDYNKALHAYHIRTGSRIVRQK